ncbi:hypothetical protein K0T92_19110 [Paenibacillus oenotherae]|uniref:Uncharacterized protein n=1 Tax=Paenibacillus oenotherae TaxID=1435645 RepID=A0ABS7DAL3_9BACL|nr:hypothetical protein [Paenibacillus oenotherae]MBW7476829.1 hypothetical protein [Paenibacillus oenotherae]
MEMMVMRMMAGDRAGRRRFTSGQRAPFDGIYADCWGGRLPLLQGERLPRHRIMGDSKWIYEGHLSLGLPVSSRAIRG